MKINNSEVKYDNYMIDYIMYFFIFFYRIKNYKKIKSFFFNKIK